MSACSRTPAADVDITEEAQLQDPSLDRSDSLDQKLPLMANLSGDYSLESSGTERYDLYIDRAAAYDKAQQHAQKSAHLVVCLLASSIKMPHFLAAEEYASPL